MVLNSKAALRCFGLVWVHLLHAVIPIEKTSHEIKETSSETSPEMDKRETAEYKWPPKGRVMLCNKGGGPIHPDCTWEGGVECSGEKMHRYNQHDGCCGKGTWFCMRAGVHRQCINYVEMLNDSFKKLYPDDEEGQWLHSNLYM